jgi:hypothetical protein
MRPPMPAPFLLAALLAAALPTDRAAAAEVMVVGTPHLASLQPAASPAALEDARARLAGFRPTLVCIEALPGESVQAFVREPDRYGELLATFAAPAVQLAPPAQLRLAMDASAAREAARQLERQPGPLDTDAQWRLVLLQLAAHEPWSAALTWSSLPDDARAEQGRRRLGADAVAALDRMLASPNEIATLALPLARRFGHRRLCHADPIVDEVAVAPLGEALMPLMQDPAIGRGIEALNQAQANEWRAEDPRGLGHLLAWTNGDAFSRADRGAQWDIFAADPRPHDAGERRLSLWHARNAEIAAHVYRALASEEGERTLLLIGAAHRPFLEAAFAAQPWVTVTSANRLLAQD